MWRGTYCPCRCLLGRQRLRWDALFFALRLGPRRDRRRSPAQGGTAGGSPRSSEGYSGGKTRVRSTNPAAPAPAEDDPRTQDPIASGPEAAVGIDLGTTFSVIAHLDPTGRPWTVANAEGDATTPSVVLFDGDATVVGKEALKSAAMEPDRVAQFAKRDMGGTSYSRTINGQSYPPEVIQSLVLAKLKRDCEDRIGPVRKAVVTVPAYFNEPRRRATLDAGRLAGLEVLDIINEPTAAALAFGVQHGFLTAKGESKQAETILVYDLGGGTFDATLMAIDGRDYRALATAGDVPRDRLGPADRGPGAEEFKAKHRGLDLRITPAPPATMVESRTPPALSRGRATIVFEHAGQGIRVMLSRDRFEEMTGDLLERRGSPRRDCSERRGRLGDRPILLRADRRGCRWSRGCWSGSRDARWTGRCQPTSPSPTGRRSTRDCFWPTTRRPCVACACGT
ncbi:MAG: Hsp70 family protein [Singulisphaera sp.]